MSSHLNVRLETPDAEVIAYLAPNFEVRPNIDNSLAGGARPRGEASIVRDVQQITDELTVQGVFEHSSNLPEAHAAALEGTFAGGLPVTPRDQVNRIRHFMHGAGGPFYFFDGSDSYTAESSSEVDWEDGTFPAVAISQFRPPNTSGLPRHEYTIKMSVGLES